MRYLSASKPDFRHPPSSSIEDTCLISASEMRGAYFPNRCIDENTEIVRKQHVGFRNYDAGKGNFLVSLRHESRYGTLILLDMGTFSSCVPLSSMQLPNLVEPIRW